MKKHLPLLALIVAAGYILYGFLPSSAKSDSFDFDAFGKTPVLRDGRIKPMDTVARTSLLILRDQQTVKGKDGETMSAIHWLTQLMMDPAAAADQKVFLINDPAVVSIFKVPHDLNNVYSFRELAPGFSELQHQTDLATPIPNKKRTPFQRHVIHLRNQVILYLQLSNSLQPQDSQNFAKEIVAYAKSIGPGFAALTARQAKQPYNKDDFNTFIAFADRYKKFAQTADLLIAPPIDPAKAKNKNDWKNQGQSLLDTVGTRVLHPVTVDYAKLIAAYNAKSPKAFNQTVAQLHNWMAKRYPKDVFKCDLESFFNRIQLFYTSMILYVIVFLLVIVSWLVLPDTLGRTAFYLALLALVLHTGGLIFRMYLEGRPPVTNLYSAAVFVGWGSVVLGLILEWIYRNGIGSIVAATVGFCTLMVAHHLSNDGDTMEMMRAVLNNNFWLATHVVVVTTGYASTYVAGFLGLIYVFRGMFTKNLDRDTAKSLSKMVYGVVCFATLFSFSGTVLGGIWADQSWGRFWGWDPKENGAILIVLWNAIILHARWGGMIRERGLMIMAIFGNIVTSWSFFGTNMLGIGLHSYGFMAKSFWWLTGFCISQALIMAIAALPPRFWRSPIKA